MAAVPKAWRQAAEHWGYLADSQAHQLGLPNGATLLLKIASGESNFNMRAVSSAGARGGTQFMPATRQSFIDKYGVDAWKDPDEAMHATALYMKASGLKAYNPGDPSYVSYILKQPVSLGSHSLPVGHGVHPKPPPEPEPSSSGGDLMHIGLVGVLVIGGVVMVGTGLTRMLGTAQRPA